MRRVLYILFALVGAGLFIMDCVFFMQESGQKIFPIIGIVIAGMEVFMCLSFFFPESLRADTRSGIFKVIKEGKWLVSLAEIVFAIIYFVFLFKQGVHIYWEEEFEILRSGIFNWKNSILMILVVNGVSLLLNLIDFFQYYKVIKKEQSSSSGYGY